MSERQQLKQDDDGHRFCIPLSLSAEFENQLLKAIAEDDYSNFNVMFGEYMLDCHLSAYSFLDFKEELNMTGSN